MLPQLGRELPCGGLADLARANDRLDIQWLVELIQAPTCDDPQAVLRQLAQVTGQRFGSIRKTGTTM
jgi:hypothetical protein